MQYALVQDGKVVNVVLWDGTPYTPAVPPDENGEGGSPATGWAPPDGTTAISLPENSEAGIGWSYDGSQFIAPPVPQPSPAEIVSTNTSMRDALLSGAALSIAPLQDAVDLDEATDAETALLKLWKQYRVAVNRVDLTQPTPVWPTAPAN